MPPSPSIISLRDPNGHPVRVVDKRGEWSGRHIRLNAKGDGRRVCIYSKRPGGVASLDESFTPAAHHALGGRILGHCFKSQGHLVVPTRDVYLSLPGDMHTPSGETLEALTEKVADGQFFTLRL